MPRQNLYEKTSKLEETLTQFIYVSLSTYEFACFPWKFWIFLPNFTFLYLSTCWSNKNDICILQWLICSFDFWEADANVFVWSWSCHVQQSPKMEGTVFTPALQEIEHVKSDQGEILSKPFLDACKHILPVIGASCSLPCYWHKNNKRKEHIDVILDYGHFPKRFLHLLSFFNG